MSHLTVTLLNIQQKGVFNMDNEYNYSPYQYGDTLNTQTEQPQEDVSVEEATQDVVVEEVEENVVTEEAVAETTEEPVYQYTYKVPEKKEEPKKKKKSSTGKKWILCVCMAIVFGLVASSVFQASNFIIGSILGEEEKEEPKKTIGSTQITTDKDTDKELTDVAQVAANAMPSVVSITTLTVQEVQNFFFGGTTVQEYESTGSGIIVGQNDTELLVVSNNHVVEGSKSLTVSFVDGKSVEAQIKATDGDIDLAIIAVPLAGIESDTMDAIKVATLGDSDSLDRKSVV